MLKSVGLRRQSLKKAQFFSKICSFLLSSILFGHFGLGYSLELRANCAANIVAIVDPYSSGQALIKEFRQQGWQVVVVHADPPERSEPAFWKSYNESGLQNETLSSYTVDKEEDAFAILKLGRLLKNMPIRAVLAGAETGVQVANELAQEMGLPHNGGNEIYALTDKFEMQEKIRRAGLRAIRQRRSTNLEDLLHWARENNRWLESPLVMKPPASAGTNGVRFVYSEADIAEAYQAIFQNTNGLNRRNESVLIQEYIDGIEFAVDTVSLDADPLLGLPAHHVVTEILRYERYTIPGAATLYRANHMLPFEAMGEALSEPAEISAQSKLVSYAKQVLEALEIRNGPAHMELKLTPGGEVVLIEVGARICGAQTPSLVRHTTGNCQVGLTVEAITNQRSFRNRPEGYELRKEGLHFFVHTQKPGSFLNREILEEVRRLPGVIAVFPHFNAETPLPRSIDADTIPLDIQIVAEDLIALSAIRAVLENWESEGLFERP